FGRGHPDQLRDLGHRLGAEPTILFLRQVTKGQQRRARLGIEGDQLAGPGCHRRVEVAHRSTSPITGSTDEMMATASAIIPPRSITGSVWRLTKLGPRMCIR